MINSESLRLTSRFIGDLCCHRFLQLVFAWVHSHVTPVCQGVHTIVHGCARVYPGALRYALVCLGVNRNIIVMATRTWMLSCVKWHYHTLILPVGPQKTIFALNFNLPTSWHVCNHLGNPLIFPPGKIWYKQHPAANKRIEHDWDRRWKRTSHFYFYVLISSLIFSIE